jgi:hypothetical protein
MPGFTENGGTGLGWVPREFFYLLLYLLDLGEETSNGG